MRARSGRVILDVVLQPPYTESMSSDARFVISRFRNVYDNRPQSISMDLHQLRQLLTEWLPPRLEKTRVPCWSPVRYPKGAKRRKAAVRDVSALVFDCDDGTPPEVAREAFSGWCQLGHTSWSHSIETPKWRLVLPLAEPIPASHWPAAFAAGLKLWAWFMPAGSHPDRRCRDASRLFFLPVFRYGQDARATWADQGDLLRLDYDPAVVPEPEPAASRQRTWKLKPFIRHRLKTDPRTRAALGQLMGGRVHAGLVTGVDCPGCGQPAARWAVDPARGVGGYCGGEDCDWAGTLDTLSHGLGDLA